MRSTQVFFFVSISRICCIFRYSLGTSNIPRCSPKSIGKMSIERPRQSLLTINKSSNDFLRVVQLVNVNLDEIKREWMHYATTKEFKRNKNVPGPMIQFPYSLQDFPRKDCEGRVLENLWLNTYPAMQRHTPSRYP